MIAGWAARRKKSEGNEKEIGVKLETMESYNLATTKKKKNYCDNLRKHQLQASRHIAFLWKKGDLLFSGPAA